MGEEMLFSHVVVMKHAFEQLIAVHVGHEFFMSYLSVAVSDSYKIEGKKPSIIALKHVIVSCDLVGFSFEFKLYRLNLVCQ